MTDHDVMGLSIIMSVVAVAAIVTWARRCWLGGGSRGAISRPGRW